MKWKKMGFFALAVLINVLLAAHRWGDSGHAIGLMSLNGGMTRHPVVMEGGRNHYAQITTVTVLPPFQGAARIAVEGAPPLDYDLHLARPVVDLGFRQIPELRGDTLYNIRAGDRLALWTLFRPADSDRRHQASSGAAVYGRYSLAFYDAATGKPLLSIPLVFTTPGEENERHQN